MSHQDWETVVFKKGSAKGGNASAAAPREISQQTFTETGKPAWKIEKMADGESGKPVCYVSADAAKAIVGGRIAAKLTQKQLAQKLNISEKDIKDIESGKAVENKALLSRIRRTLNI